MSALPRLRWDAGVTLVELIVALAIFALISVAGFTLIDSTLRVRERTDGRLERLADLQRAAHILTADLEQAAPGPMVLVDDTLVFLRAGPAAELPAVPVAYRLEGGVLRRAVAGAAGSGQALLPGVRELRWRFFTPGVGWTDAPPPPPVVGPPLRPTAVEATLEVEAVNGSPAGSLRRLAVLPALP